jgi:agmatinase
MTGRKQKPGVIGDDRIFANTQSFMGVPFSHDLSRARAAILGIPFDCGTHPVRIGARQGPMAIREQSRLVRPYQPTHANFNPLAELGVVDCGDARVTASVIEPSLATIEEAVWRIADAGAVPVTMGGDGLGTLPQLRAMHRLHHDLVVLHIDAHTDCYPDGEGLLGRYNTAACFTRAAEEGLVDLSHSMHVGARGTVYDPAAFEHPRKLGYEVIDGDELFAVGLADVARHIHQRIGKRPVYLCFDMDFFDPSCAPGVCTPTWGGPTAREGLGFLRSLAGLEIVAVDVNTVSPPHDVGGMTAFLAGTVIIESLALIAKRWRND